MAARPMMAKGINFCLSISNLFSSIIHMKLHQVIT